MARRKRAASRTPAPKEGRGSASNSLGLRTKASLWTALALIYLLVGTWFQFDFGEIMGYYSLFADALLAGRLHVAPTPDEVNLVDMIPYEGRYYLQWGPFPGLFHAAAKLAGLNLSDRVASIAATWLGAVVFLEIALLLRRRHFPAAPAWLAPAFFFLYGLGTPAALTAYRGTVYNESISIGATCVLAAYYALLRFQREPSAAWALASGAALAGALTTRVTLALYAGILGFGLLLAAARSRRVWAPAVAYAAPIILGIALMPAYNQARFGSPWDYGNRYKPGETSDLAAFSLARVPENLGHYLFSPPRLSADFPWMEHVGWAPVRRVSRAEAMSSLLLASPFLLFAAAAAKEWLERLRRKEFFDDWTVATGVALLGSAAMFGVLLAFASASRRYAHDFVPLAAVASFLGAGLLVERRGGAPPGWWKPVGAAVLVLSFALHAQIAFVQAFRTPTPDLNASRLLIALGPTLRSVVSGPELRREEAVARNDWGSQLIRRGRLNEAIAQFRTAAELWPDSERIRRNLEMAEALVQGR